jgi:exodeoxyribonuclease VII small subunit
MSENRNNENLSFEAALARLEEIVRALESGNAPLDSSLAMFEEGVSLVRLCGDKLDRAEQRIKILVSNGDGEMTEQDFAPTSAR